MKNVKTGALPILLFVLLSVSVDSGAPQTIHVPMDAPTIQAGIDLASDGDLVLVSPGVYRENLQLLEKTITLASYYYTTGDTDYIEQTIVDGNGGAIVIDVAQSVGTETVIVGFTIQNGGDGVSSRGEISLLNNRIINNGDGIDYESGGGICRSNVLADNQDDGIDLDGDTAVTIQGNSITGNGDDGIEIRLHAYSGPVLEIVVRSNVISGNGEDGIQLIDYPDVSSRVFRIEHNLLSGNAMVGLGAMSNGNTVENFEGASIPERVYSIGNTIVGNDHGVTGGDNLIALNNIVFNSVNIGMKNVDGDSVASHNLFWANGTDYQDSNVVLTNTVLEVPRLSASYRLLQDSPAIDAGTAVFTWNSEIVLDLSPNMYCGSAPDLGAYEACWLFLPLILK